MEDHSEERPVPGFPGYMVTNDGRVISYALGKRRVLRPQVDKYGYLTVRLTRTDSTPKRPHVAVHRMVLRAFVGEPAGDARLTRHLNGNSLDNRLENLAWGTYSDNLNDAVRHGTANGLRRGEDKIGTAKLTESQVYEIERRSRSGESERALAREFDISYRHVHSIKHHQVWAHLWKQSA